MLLCRLKRRMKKGSIRPIVFSIGSGLVKHGFVRRVRSTSILAVLICGHLIELVSILIANWNQDHVQRHIVL